MNEQEIFQSAREMDHLQRTAYLDDACQAVMKAAQGEGCLELTLAETLCKFDNRYDYVIVDTSPGWDPLTVNVLFYINELLIPVSLEIMTLQGLVEFLNSISAIQKYRKDVSLRYILPTFLDKRVSKSEGVLDKLTDLYGNKMCLPIRYNVRISEAPAYGQTIYEYAPGSPGTQDYRELVRKVADNPGLFK